MTTPKKTPEERIASLEATCSMLTRSYAVMFSRMTKQDEALIALAELAANHEEYLTKITEHVRTLETAVIELQKATIQLQKETFPHAAEEYAAKAVRDGKAGSGTGGMLN